MRQRKGQVASIFIIFLLIVVVFSGYMLVEIKQKLDKSLKEYSLLRKKYEETERKYLDIYNRYKNIKSGYDSLRKERDKYKSLYNTLKSNYKRLEQKLRQYESASLYRVGLDLNRARGLFEYRNPSIYSLVYAITRGYSGIKDMYNDIYRMFYWVSRNIRYANDPAFKYLRITGYYEIYGERFIADFEWGYAGEYWRYPHETLATRKGDCEDMAILLATMIKCYTYRYIGKPYSYYVVGVHFTDGTGHVFVILPVQGGRIIILDPAGHYYTGHWGRLYARSAEQEMAHYQYTIRKTISKVDFVINDSFYMKNPSYKQFMRLIKG